MTVSRKGGVTGKTCSVCGVWKRLSEFAADRDRAKFRGYRQVCCLECTSALKAKKKEKP